MQPKTIALTGAAALLALAVGCESAQKERVDARNEANREMGRAQEKVNEEREELARSESPREARDEREDVTDAQQKLAKEQAEARKEVGKADAQYNRFEALRRDETREAFAARADGAIVELEREATRLQGELTKASPDRRDEIMDDIDDARRNTTEARRDLVEVKEQTGGVIDDGRLGVAFAINRARRSLEDAEEALVEETTPEPPKSF